MSLVQLSDTLKQVIDRQIAEGRATSEAEFLDEAVRRYAEELDADQTEILAAADDGIADIAAGRFETIADANDMLRLRARLADHLDRLAQLPGNAEP